MREKRAKSGTTLMITRTARCPACTAAHWIRIRAISLGNLADRSHLHDARFTTSLACFSDNIVQARCYNFTMGHAQFAQAKRWHTRLFIVKSCRNFGLLPST